MQVDYAMEIFEKNGGDMNGTINVASSPASWTTRTPWSAARRTRSS